MDTVPGTLNYGGGWILRCCALLLQEKGRYAAQRAASEGQQGFSSKWVRAKARGGRGDGWPSLPCQ